MLSPAVFELYEWYFYFEKTVFLVKKSDFLAFEMPLWMLRNEGKKF